MNETDRSGEQTKQLELQLLERVPEELRAQVAQAVEVAKFQHMGQLRQGGKPYISHVLAVAEKAAQHAIDHADSVDIEEARKLIIGALLHDIVEDTSMTSEQIEALFGADIAALVLSLSHEYEEESNKVYLARVAQGGPLAVLIKRFDKTHNLESLAEASEEFRAEKLGELQAEIELWRSFDPEGTAIFEERFL